MAAWKRGPEAGYNGRCAGHFCGAVHLEPICKPWDRAPWNGKSKLCFPAKRHHQAKQKSTRYMKNEATTVKAKPTSRARYTPEDDSLILQLKEKGLSSVEIAERSPGRTPGAIEVRYHTWLKAANTSRRRARQPRDHSQPPSVDDHVDDESGGSKLVLTAAEGRRERILQDNDIYQARLLNSAHFSPPAGRVWLLRFSLLLAPRLRCLVFACPCVCIGTGGSFCILSLLGLLAYRTVGNLSAEEKQLLISTTATHGDGDATQGGAETSKPRSRSRGSR